MLMQFMKEVEQESFDSDECVEKLAWRTVGASGGKDSSSKFDPNLLHATFTEAIKELTVMQERQKKECEKLEEMFKEEEANDTQRIVHLQEKNKAALTAFNKLDERINYVATKVIRLGDNLESVNTPRSRDVEAQKLMHHIQDFLVPGPLMDDVFTDKSRIYEAADVIQKLNSISLELPDDKFGEAKRKISAKYDEIERSLIEEFARAHRGGDVQRMKEIAGCMMHFKGHAQCVDAFIEHSQMGAFTGTNVFEDVIPLCRKNYDLMCVVFNNPEQVMAKFVLNIFHLKLTTYISSVLSDKSDSEKYLKRLYELYTNTAALTEQMTQFNMGRDDSYIPRIQKSVFRKYLDSYIGVETKFLRDRCAAALRRYYDSKNHQKKQIQTGGFQDLRRDLQAVIGTRANINIAQIEDYGGETFVSEELAIALLQDFKMALKRCLLLSQPSEVAGNAVQILEILLQNLMVEHVDYALELGLQTVPIPESKNQPVIYFLHIVRRTNVIVHLLEKFFADSVLPLVVSTPKHQDCLAKKRYLLESIEIKLDTGLDRSVSAVVGWVKMYLQSEQKKTDFKPETDNLDTLSSQACLQVSQFMTRMIGNVKESLDDKNVETVMTELGTRFHKVIYDHLQQYQFNTAGAMCVICDVNEYRKCIKELKVPLVMTLFDKLHALCNLLLVKPENLKQVCTGEQLAGLDQAILFNFIQLRSDFKTQKLANSLRAFNS